MHRSARMISSRRRAAYDSFLRAQDSKVTGVKLDVVLPDYNPYEGHLALKYNNRIVHDPVKLELQMRARTLDPKEALPDPWTRRVPATPASTTAKHTLPTLAHSCPPLASRPRSTIIHPNSLGVTRRRDGRLPATHWAAAQLDSTPFGRMGRGRIDLAGAKAYKLRNNVFTEQYGLGRH